MKANRISGIASVYAVCLLAWSTGAAATCDPSSDPDRTDIANARAAVESACHCQSASSHAEYVRCSATTLASALANPDCARVAQACARRSTCGRPGVVTCCRTNARGDTRCSIKRDAAACRPPRGGIACVGGTPSCYDACSTTECSTTTTTLFGPRCPVDCSGLSCPTGQAGVYLRSQCGCAPEPACGGTGGMCGGNCPVDVPTEGCHYDTFNGCCLCGGP